MSNVKCQIDFLGRVTKDELRSLYQNCQALIITQKEDFGIAAVEAQACGRPVIAYSRGGQGEILRDGETGILFKSQTTDALQDAIKVASKLKWSVSACRKNALRFTRKNFVGQLTQAVDFYARVS
ncbi:glycosyltransferase [Candidatus Curtissbacteria bacterium]|nr:glycosyltransferase [Candidatus Curtissbacteria bacterium]